MLEEIEKEVNKKEFSCDDDRDEVILLFKKAKEAIYAWKAHQLRSIHQDRARISVLDSLDSSSGVFIVQDFAMKFIPAQYREAQSDFFGKRGISWHVSVCHTKINGRIETQTLIHILKSGIQDSETIVLIMEHVLLSLKKQHPEITTAFFQQDNAGCYHSALTILSSNIISKRTGILVSQIDFSDPQGGKGSCDRKAAQVKAHVKSFINEGHSVTTPNELKQAIESRGGIPGVRAAVVEVQKKYQESPKIEGISTLNNFSFSKRGFKAFRAYGVGSGKFFSWSTAFKTGRVRHMRIFIIIKFINLYTVFICFFFSTRKRGFLLVCRRRIIWPW